MEKAQLEAAKPAFTTEIQQKTNDIEKRKLLEQIISLLT